MEALEIRRLLSAFYVSNSGANNDDGSIAHPFATIQFAASRTQPGDVVNVEQGVYAGFVLGWDIRGTYGPINGLSGAPITIQADPAAPAGSVYINSRNDKTPSGIDLEPGNSFINIRGFSITNDGSITNYGIKVAQSNDINILNNSVTLAGKTGIFTSFSDDDLIQGNVSHDNGEHGIYVSNSPVKVQIIRNVSYNNANGGIQINADGNQGGTGVAQNCLVAFNEIFNNGIKGGGALNFDGLQNSYVEDNLLFGNHSSGIVLFREDASGGSINNVIANNTVLMAADGRWALEINNGSTGNLIFNNILFNLNQNLDRGDILIDAISAAGTQSDHNVLGGIESLYGNTITLAQWRVLTGQDTHSIASTPSAVFANAAANNLHILIGSAAVGIGVAVFGGAGAPNTDFQGHYFTGGIVDAGVYHLPVRTVADARTPSLNDLIVIGSTGNDTISFDILPSGLVYIHINGQDKGFFHVSTLAIIKAYGGVGNDTIGVDPNIRIPARLVGGTGNNLMAASSNFDTLIGQGGDDSIFGFGAGDLLIGGAGNNSLQAGGASDTFMGGAGNDTLIGAGGDNLMYGFGGSDLIFTAVGSANTVFGGSGQDTLHALGQVTIPDNDISQVLQS